jgi:hypothetical protein
MLIVKNLILSICHNQYYAYDFKNYLNNYDYDKIKWNVYNAQMIMTDILKSLYLWFWI